jgi:hypothetical protein
VSEKISSILNNFEPVGLEEIMGVRFMTRIDSKYLFPVNRLAGLLNQNRSTYKVLEIEGHREYRYKTIYFDTPDLLFYNQHVTGKLTRHKVRLRTYKTNGLTFLEVKEKSNKGRTSKTRIRSVEGDLVDHEQSHQFLHELINADTSSLKPVITTGFTRITLANTDGDERITIDYNISWHNFRGECYNMPFLSIAEIKCDKPTSLSPFFQQLKKLGIRSTGFSKYCTGMALLGGVTKTNNLKPKIILLNKILDEYNRNGSA